MTVELREARSRLDLEAVFAVRHQVFALEERRLPAREDGWLFDRFDSFTESVSLIAMVDGEPAGSIRITLDGPLGSPLDAHYDLGRLRSRCLDEQGQAERTAVVTSLCVRRTMRRVPRVTGGLLQAAVAVIRRMGAAHVVAVVNPQIRALMAGVGLTAIGAPAHCPRVGQSLLYMHGRLCDITVPRIEAATSGQYQPVNLAPRDRLSDLLSTRALVVLDDLGVLDALPASTAQLAAALSLESDVLDALLGYLAITGQLRRHGACWMLAEPEVRGELAFVRWLGGYQGLLDDLPALLRGARTFQPARHRDAAQVARASAQIGEGFTDHHLREVLCRPGVRRIADIGCGSAERLIALCQQLPALSAVGIEQSADCCRIAKASIEAAGLTERIRVIEGMAEECLPEEQVDLVLCVGMFHDLLNAGTAERFLLAVRRGLAPGGMLVVLDQLAVSAPSAGGWGPGFALIHQLMGQRLFSPADCIEVFEVAGFTVLQQQPTDIPDNQIFILQAG